MKKKQLLREIEKLEIETEHRTAIVLALMHAVKPANAFRHHYYLYAINNRFGARDLADVEAFFQWAERREDLESARAMYGSLCREDLIEAFDEMVPTRKGKLEEILLADRADGDLGIWQRWARVVLDHELRVQRMADDVTPNSAREGAQS